MTQIQWSEDQEQATGEREFPGFWYHIEGPWTRQSGLDQATVTGTFTLFVNNVTLTIEHANGTWERWTGYQQQGPDHPAQDQATEYEIRVTVLTVHNGTLKLQAPDAIDLLAPNATTDVQGTVSVPAARGNLKTPSLTYLYDDDPVELRGDGRVSLSTTPAGGTSRGVIQAPSQPGLTLAPHGDFAITPTPGVETRSVASGPASGLTDVWPWLLGVAAAAAVLYVSRHRIAERLYKHKANRRNDRTTRWMQTGDRLFEMREFEAALDWYQRIVDAYPNSIEGWDSVAAVHRELEAYEEAADAYETVSELLNGDAPSLAQAAACAWRAGQDERAVKLAVTAGRSDAGTLARRIDGPAFEGLREHPEVRKVLGREDPGGGTSASYV